MKIEVMIYIYGAVCASMIVFNVVYNLLMKRSEPRMKKRSSKIKSQIVEQLEFIRSNQPIQETHFNYLRHKLSHVNNLIAFSRVMDELSTNEPELEKEYMNQIQSVVLYLAVTYQSKEDMQAGYFAFFLSNYIVERDMPINSLQGMVLNYVRKKNLYCRFNALKALYHFADVEYILEALKIQDDNTVFLHEKLLTEGLLSFHGNHDQLISQLLKQLSDFSEHTQLAILNYIRFKSPNYKEEMYAMLSNQKTEKEQRISTIRYFGKYYYEPALSWLLSFAQDKDPAHWEYACVAVSSLSIYPGENVLNVLKEALHSENWYIRFDAAQSLEYHHVEYSDLFDIVMGNDRYAREMIVYRLESHKLQEKEVARL